MDPNDFALFNTSHRCMYSNINANLMLLETIVHHGILVFFPPLDPTLRLESIQASIQASISTNKDVDHPGRNNLNLKEISTKHIEVWSEIYWHSKQHPGSEIILTQMLARHKNNNLAKDFVFLPHIFNVAPTV